MPIEVRELVVKASVSHENQKEKDTGMKPEALAKLKAQIVEACMEQLAEAFEKQNRR